MTQSYSSQYWKLGLASSLVVGGVLTSSGNCAFAEVIPDGTLGAESSIVTPLDSLTNQIDGGATRNTNLFHSFEQFSVPSNGEVRFNNDLKIQNIITRVTGSSASTIDGLIRANGNVNLFLINPQGIIFGPNASLKIGGSFIASTASSLNFADGRQFTATAPQATPLLTVSIPSGLQFGATAASILNQSQASPDKATNSLGRPVGLQVETGKTLALVGGDVALEGGNITAAGGQIELGSVAGNSLVSLNPIEKGWTLGYESVHDFQNISINSRTIANNRINSFVDASGNSSGDVQIQGKQLMLTDDSRILSITQGLEGGNLKVIASESVKLAGRRTQLRTGTDSDGDAGNITINTKKLIVEDRAQVLTSTSNNGSGGQLTINASESIELFGSLDNSFSGLVSATSAAGDAGNITINTRRLLIQDGAKVTTQSASRTVSGQTTLATGRGGDLTVNASDSVNLIGTDPTSKQPGGLFTSTQGSGSAGRLKIATRNLIVQDGAEVTVSSQGTGNAGDLEVTANSIELDNRGKLTATSESGEGGDIKLQELDLLLLRDNSEISTTAGSATGGTGNGGNITINTDVLVGLEDSDITANAFEGKGGNIKITTQGLFLSPDSDITASSEEGIDGVVEINRPEAEPSSGLVTLPTELVDVSRLIAQGCAAGGGNVARGASQFVATGRGGLPPTPTEALRSDTVLADLGTPVQGEARASAASPNLTNSQPTPIVEAQGWVIGSKGEVVLTAQALTLTRIPWLTPTSCNAS